VRLEFPFKNINVSYLTLTHAYTPVNGVYVWVCWERSNKV